MDSRVNTGSQIKASNSQMEVDDSMNSSSLAPNSELGRMLDNIG